MKYARFRKRCLISPLAFAHRGWSCPTNIENTGLRQAAFEKSLAMDASPLHYGKHTGGRPDTRKETLAFLLLES